MASQVGGNSLGKLLDPLADEELLRKLAGEDRLFRVPEEFEDAAANIAALQEVGNTATRRGSVSLLGLYNRSTSEARIENPDHGLEGNFLLFHNGCLGADHLQSGIQFSQFIPQFRNHRRHTLTLHWHNLE